MNTATTAKIDPHGQFSDFLGVMFRDLGRMVGEVNVDNGWDTSRGMLRDPDAYDPKWVVAHKIAELGLITTEVAEAIEEVRGGHAMTETYYVKGSKPEGIPSELADVLIRVLDIADAYGIDLGAAVVEKLNNNATRGLHHGGKAL